MKQKTNYVCNQCNAISPKWLGRCSNCSAWDSMVEVQQSSKSHSKTFDTLTATNSIMYLDEVPVQDQERLTTNNAELDRVLGGGITQGSLILLGGEPGIGKSTLLLQMCATVPEHIVPLYITGEESLFQVKMRSERLFEKKRKIKIAAETDMSILDSILSSDECGLVIVDSIQTVFDPNIDAPPGSTTQIRQCASLLMKYAKQLGKPIFLIGHVTKEGTIAGPKILEHMVDTVLQFEGDKTLSYRIVRAIKNRFGPTNELGIFRMVKNGLQEVTNPSELFMSDYSTSYAGTSITSTIEGTRTLLIEIQALVAKTPYPQPQRSINGYDYKRFQMIVAVLEKRIGLGLREADVFVNIVGGLFVEDPAVDLAIACAIVSSYKDTVIKDKTVIIGEVGLTGEVRAVSDIEKRLSEAQKLGFQKAVIPKANANKIEQQTSLEIFPVERISLAITEIFK
jgi:DNA repair protein RadA/Sms